MPWILLVTWTEPSEGKSAHGPYPTRQAAEAAWPTVQDQYENEGEVPPDVEAEAVPLD